MMRFGSLFAGVGGFDLGLECAGMECAWQVEIDDFCRQILAKHWPNTARFRDVRECGGHNLPAVDLICGGFPCQPFSTAGRRKGTADERWLWPEMARIVGEVRPRWVLAENPPGIAPALDGIARDLEGHGYEVLCLEVPAAAFGASHLRYRTLIVAHLAGSGLEGKRLPVRQEGQEQAEAHTAGAGEAEANSDGERCTDGCGSTRQAGQEGSGISIADADILGSCQGFAGRRPQSEYDRWPPEPDVVRVVHGLPRGLDRLAKRRVAALGNAIIPALAEWAGRKIVSIETNGH